MKLVYSWGYTETVIVHDGRSDVGVTLLSQPYRAAGTVSDDLQIAQVASPVAPPSDAQRRGEDDVGEDVHEPGGAEEDVSVILLIDDNRLVRTSLAMMLDDLGFQVIEAETAQQALTALGAAGRVDAALVDFRLPDMNGLELAARLRAMRPHLKMVIVSGQPVGAAELAQIPGPSVGMLLKPFNAAQLEELIYAP